MDQLLVINITVTSTPSHAQLAAWSKLWGILLPDPQHSPAPTAPPERAEGQHS